MSQVASNIKKAEQCPFCGANVDPEGLQRGDGVRGPECEGCGATAPSLEAWNQRVHPGAQNQMEVGSLKFPTMLRKMWSGGEVQEWLDLHIGKLRFVEEDLRAQLAERNALLLEIVETVGPTVISHRRYTDHGEGCTGLMEEVSGPPWLDKAGKMVGVDAFLVASAERKVQP